MHKLEEYILKNNLTKRGFAKLSGVPRELIYFYITKNVIPSRKNMTKITKATDNKITPNDFYNTYLLTTIKSIP